ncbi:MAG: serine hydrolase domain-containing protein, partial [Pyrinomonadaceae bacterium]
VLVGRNGKVVYRKAFGNRALVPKVEGMTVDTIFDVASLTKPVATATSIMILLERGKIRLNDTIGQFIPEIKDERAKRVTIRQLLTHTSGYAPDFDLSKKWTGYDAMLQQLYEEPLRFEPGTRFVYSDIGFIVLGEIVRRVVEKEKLKAGGCKRNCFEEFVRENVFEPLGMKDSQFFYNGEDNPKLNRIAPTESFKGQQSYLGSKFEGDEESGNKILRGVVHDPTASRMGGVAGHAGLFSTADDLARFCQMILDGGKFDGKRILSSATIAKWIQPQVVSESGATRALGWDMNTGYSSNRGDFFPLGSFGHTGFTGTSIWIDPLSKTFVIFLSNRVHPDGKGDVTTLRGKISTIVASAIEDLTLEAIKRAEADYFTAVSAQLESFKSQVNTRTVSQTAGRDSDGKSQSV